MDNETVPIRSAHTKNAQYESSGQIRSAKFGPSSLRFSAQDMSAFARLQGYDARLNYALAIIAGWSYADGQALADRLKYYGLTFATINEISVVNPAMLIVSSAFFGSQRVRAHRRALLSGHGARQRHQLAHRCRRDFASLR